MAYETDGSTMYARVSRVPFTSLPLWISAWIRFPAVPSTVGAFVSLCENGGFSNYVNGLNNTTPRLSCRHRGSAVSGFATVSHTLTLGVWYHFFCQFISGTNRWTLVDVVNTQQGTTNITDAQPYAHMTLGNIWHGSSTTNWFDGQMAEVVIGEGEVDLTTEIDRAIIAQLAAGFAPDTLPSEWRDKIACYWPLDQPGDFNDYSGNGFHLEPIGGIGWTDEHPSIIHAPRSRPPVSRPLWLMRAK